MATFTSEADREIVWPMYDAQVHLYPLLALSDMVECPRELHDRASPSPDNCHELSDKQTNSFVCLKD